MAGDSKADLPVNLGLIATPNLKPLAVAKDPPLPLPPMVRPRPQILPIAEEPEDPSSSVSSLACMINSEVAAVMRRNARWSGRNARWSGRNARWSGRYADEHLDHSLKSLRRLLFSPRRPSPADYLRPFLDVIRSDETGAPITGVALFAVYKIFCLDVLAPDSDDAIHSLVDAVTSCHFDSTDPSSDEDMLTKILQVLLACMRSRASAALSNQHVCTIVNTTIVNACFRVILQAGTKGELLQRISRHTMHELIRCIFSHLPDVAGAIELPVAKPEMSAVDKDQGFGVKNLVGDFLGNHNEFCGQVLDTALSREISAAWRVAENREGA